MAISEKAYEYINNKYTKRRTRREVKEGKVVAEKRIEKAKEQAELSPVPVEDVIKYVNEFLLMCGIKLRPKFDPRIECNENNLLKPNRFYNEFMKKNEMDDKRDVVWISFTTCGYVGVVGTSSDYLQSNDDVPSTVILKELGRKWDKSFVLVFPLKDIPSELSVDNGFARKSIECGIGNYLIDKGVPILDYYSHRF